MDSPHSHFLQAKQMTIKSMLARLMASENITVIQDAKAPTAMFDVKNRVLVLPKWKTMTPAMYNLLVAHEVGHAVFTPKDKSLKEICKGKPWYYNQVVQLVEDSRIEKKMKRKFQGINSEFREGYRDMVKHEIMPIPDKKTFYKEDEPTVIDPKSYLDRLIVHTKCAHYIGVDMPFSDEELPLTYAAEEVETFDQVLETADQICEYIAPYMPEPPADSDEYQESDEDSRYGEPQDDDSDSKGKKGESKQKIQRISKVQKEMEQNIQDLVEAIAKGSSKKNTKKQSQAQQEDSDNDGDEDNSYSSSRQNKDKDPWIGGDAITFDATNITALNNLLHYQDVNIELKEVYDKMQSDDKLAVHQELVNFTTRTAKVVNQMVAEFNMKKAAKMMKRVGVADKGTLDMQKLHMYKYNDDIFKTFNVVEKGQSHGVLLFLDMSGSMSSCFYYSVLQILNLVMFCRRARIPFEVFGFTDNGPAVDIYDAKKDSLHHARTADSGQIQPRTDLLVINYISSQMDHLELQLGMKNLMMLAMLQDGSGACRRLRSGYAPAAHHLSSTPLDATIFVTKDLFWRFKKANNLDIVHCIFVTDGCSDIGVISQNDNVVYDALVKNGPFVYNYGTYRYKDQRYTPLMHSDSVAFEGTTGTAIEMLRDETNCRAIAFFLCSNEYSMGSCREFQILKNDARQKAIQDFKNNGYAEVPSYYDKMFILDPGTIGLDGSGNKLISQVKARPLLTSFIKAISTHGGDNARR